MPILAALAMLAVFPASGLADFAEKSFPVVAVSQNSGLLCSTGVRILTSDQWGDYLIYRWYPRTRVFFDGRSDFYGTDFIARYSRLLDLGPGWRNEFNRWNFTQALLPPDCPLISALEANGWQELHRDRTAVLLTGKSRL
jgi:hypothetical protein